MHFYQKLRPIHHNALQAFHDFLDTILQGVRNANKTLVSAVKTLTASKLNSFSFTQSMNSCTDTGHTGYHVYFLLVFFFPPKKNFKISHAIHTHTHYIILQTTDNEL